MNNPPFSSLNGGLKFDLSSCNGSFTPQGTWAVESVSEISFLCPNVISNCQSSSSSVSGFGEITFVREYDIDPGSCTQAEMELTSCCRNSSITASPNPNSLGTYNSITIPLDSTVCNNSSPQFLQDVNVFVCNQDTVRVNVSAFDPDGDSLNYQLSQPYTNTLNPSPIPYNAGFSPTQPLGANWDVSLDPQSGELVIVGNGASPETGVILIEALEYRNGVLLGSAETEFNLIGINCIPDDAADASPVVLNGGGLQINPFGLQAYVGVPLSFSLTFTDSSASQLILQNTLDQQLPGATITQSGTNPLTVYVTWTPDSSYGGQVFFAGPTVYDDNCPTPNSTYQPILFKVVDFGLEATITDSDCQQATGAIDLDIRGGGVPFDVVWSNGDTTEDLTNLSAGAYTATLTGSSGFTLTRTYFVNSGSLQVNLGSDEPGCSQDDGSLSANAFGGSAPYSYQWSTGATGSSISGLAPGGYSVTVTDSLGCFQGESVVLDRPDSCTSFINGRVYFDANSNCTYDPGIDVPTPGILVLLSNGLGILTDSAGEYRLDVGTGSNVAGAVLIGDSTACFPKTYAFNLPLGADSSGFDFPWFRLPVQDISVTATGVNVVPGNETRVFTTLKNDGTLVMGGSVELTYDSLLTFKSGLPAPASHDPVNRVITWNYSGLLGGHSRMYEALFDVDTTAIFGTPVAQTASVTPLAGDSTPANNTFVLHDSVRAAFDPNDKRVTPAGIRELGFITQDQTLHKYQIRFQNVGNYPATNVLIRDTLDSDLLLSSLKPVSSSDPYTLKVLPGGILEFLFENIYLPDSASDPAGSIGEVTFSISHDPSLPLGTEIKNKAAIYFDFNPPIITNEVVNTLYSQPSLSLIPDPMEVYCKGDELLAELTDVGMPPYDFSWNNGDLSNRVNAEESSTQIEESGWYVVGVMDAYGFEASDSLWVEVSPSPEPDITFEIEGTDSSNIFIFDAGDSSITSYEWRIGTGIYSELDTFRVANPRAEMLGHFFLDHYVELIASNGVCTTRVEYEYITISNEPLSVFGEVKLFPHPLRETSTLTFENPRRLEHELILLDGRGRKVREVISTRNNTFEIERRGLPAGIYLYRLIREDGNAHVGKIMIR